MTHTLKEVEWGNVRILPEKTFFMQTTYEATGGIANRMKQIRRYMLSLSSENLVRNHLLEAGLWNEHRRQLDDVHWGWESPTSQLRGHFLGHWLSGAAQLYAQTGDLELKGKADAIVQELARCQQRNGGEWVFAIPEKYLEWIGRGEIVWAPQYAIHKTLMGLWDMFAYGGNEQALDILINAARWFKRWTDRFTDEEFADVLDFETGGMLEIWANLYGQTRDESHLQLMNRYWRSRLFDPLLRGEDVLTNLHANTTIPEIIGAARAWEVTGEKRWRDVVKAYWKSAVTDRGFYVTGGQTNGEAWTPPLKQAARLGKHNQEHCTVYNMMRLAHILYRWTGDTQYADYWERNLYNGLLAQEHPHTGMVAYYLPLEAGNQKKWGTPTHDFWCCHGTLVQAPASLAPAIYQYETDNALRVSQYLPSQATCELGGTRVEIRQQYNVTTKPHARPQNLQTKLTVTCEKPARFSLQLRVPWWAIGTPRVTVNGQPQQPNIKQGLIALEKEWENDVIELSFEKRLTCVSMPDDPDMVAFMDGPVVLAGLCDGEVALDVREIPPEELLVPHNELSCECWRAGYKTRGQRKKIYFLPLHCIEDEQYAVYFPLIRK